MGLAYAEIELSNPRQPEREPVVVTALADTGATMLCIPPAIVEKLDLDRGEHQTVLLADGRRISVPFVGPIRLRFENRYCFVGAFVMGDEVVLGSVPMEDLDVVVAPLTRTVTVNPLHPDAPFRRA